MLTFSEINRCLAYCLAIKKIRVKVDALKTWTGPKRSIHFFLDLICFSFFTWFATYDVPKTGTEFGQKSKNCCHCHKDPAQNCSRIGKSVQKGWAIVIGALTVKIYSVKY